ncbi:hypothetical protein CDD80_3057 [Ophiocordyceps camponoti-rufipedis]|uniref:Fungal N-terminal domain-containing protein n=1 Tax=Ophiocordyceps camponoti-rufipedis TaxID=2004952 RepID=A0A2C5Z0D2_9HYPO|nr:hypothetical protein CDD80_3057 [Ophiocordyceps camponoti-rufipedis]
MSASDILTTLNVLIKLGQEITNRLHSLNQAAEDLHLLTTNLKLLLTVFENPANENIIKTHISEFVALLDVLQSIADSCAECAKALDLQPSGEKASSGKKLLRRLWILNKIPSLLADIQRKAKHLQSVYSAVSVVMLQDIKIRQNDTTSRVAMGQDVTPKDLLDRDFITDFASIDLMLGGLMKECQSLRKQLQDTVICPDRSAIEHYQEQNPEGMAFWKDRFQKNELSLSTLRYEVLYVSWARFIHEVEQSIVLNSVPTAVYHTGNIDVIRQQGSRYTINPNGTRRLPTTRPLWLPALQSALDPLHRGYVKPQSYFGLVQTSSLSDKIRALTLENSGYGMLVECERHSSDMALPASIESPSDHVGWLSAQIVAVPTPEELGIVTEEQVLASSNQHLLSCFSGATQDIYVYVRYLETGQIERKSLLTQIRPIGGIAVGAILSTRHEFESGAHAWGPDLRVTEFNACYGGQYIITAGTGSNATLFSTTPIKINTTSHHVRPYRCLHVGDLVDAPVMYPDFRLHYHDIADSQLHLPARIIDVQGDQYVVEFSPALSAHEWWPGRQPKGTPIELVPNSGVTVENPHDFNRLTVSMDLIAI